MENEQLTDIKQLEGAIEEILFAAGHPMEYSKLGETLGLTPRDTKQLVGHLSERWNADTTRGIMLLTFDDSCQLCTRESYLPYIREALGIKRGGNLSASSLEVLAIAAYNQPVTRAFIDTVRGVDSAYAVGSLLDKADRCFTALPTNFCAFSDFPPFPSCRRQTRCLPQLTHWQIREKTTEITQTAKITETNRNKTRQFRALEVMA